MESIEYAGMANEEGLAKRVCLITGAGRGIGRSISLSLARQGAALVLASRTALELDRLVREIGDWAPTPLAIPTDVSREEDVARLVGSTLERFGRIDVLVNCAGIRPLSAMGPLQTVSSSDFESIIRVNLTGAFLCARAVSPVMRHQGRGDIVNIGSTASLTADSPGNAAYRASKFGLRALSLTLLREVKDSGIRVTLVCPGDTNTELQRHRLERGEDPARWLSGEEVAEIVSFVLRLPRHVLIPELVVYPLSQLEGGSS